MEIPHEGTYYDLIWSDHDDIESWILSNRDTGWYFEGC